MIRKHEKLLQQIVKHHKEQCINENIEFSIDNNKFKFTTKELNCFIKRCNEDIVKITVPISNSVTIAG